MCIRDRASTGDQAYPPGAVVDLDTEDFMPLPPIATVLESAAGAGEVPVQLIAQLTEVGTLEVDCVAVDDAAQRWRLAFEPVSYTHLDVYKRQIPGCPGRSSILAKSPTSSSANWRVSGDRGRRGDWSPAPKAGSLTPASIALPRFCRGAPLMRSPGSRRSPPPPASSPTFCLLYTSRCV